MEATALCKRCAGACRRQRRKGWWNSRSLATQRSALHKSSMAGQMIRSLESKTYLNDWFFWRILKPIFLAEMIESGSSSKWKTRPKHAGNRMEFSWSRSSLGTLLAMSRQSSCWILLLSTVLLGLWCFLRAKQLDSFDDQSCCVDSEMRSVAGWGLAASALSQWGLHCPSKTPLVFEKHFEAGEGLLPKDRLMGASQVEPSNGRISNVEWVKFNFVSAIVSQLSVIIRGGLQSQ